MEILATLTEGEKNAAVAGAIAGGVLGFMAVFAFALWIITIIATWRILVKAGEPGWKSIIPVYNLYMMYKIVGMSGWFWALLCGSILATILLSVDGLGNMTSEQIQVADLSKHVLGIITIVVYCIFALVADIIYCRKTAKAFHHSGLFAVGLFFLMPVFWLILGFDKSKYNKKFANA